ncbi:MAG: hypothetical protein RLZZ241_139 [Bacteroidota bacterium]|jgi:pectin methylesterase-like acyl-CoA thioesterase
MKKHYFFLLLPLFLLSNFVRAQAVELSNGKIDVWDFGGAQLDSNMYNNNLDEAKINAWYDPAIVPGSTGNVLPSWSEGVLSWVGGSNDRLRSSNTNLTRYDDNTSGVTDYTGRIYVNGSAATGRYMSLTLAEDDEVTLSMLAQNANGSIHFTYVPDPTVQDDIIRVTTNNSITQVKFVAKAAGTYRIYDASDKPSYFRVERKDAVYKTLTGNVDDSMANGLPSNYSILFTNAAGKQWSVMPSNGSYSIDLPQGYTYKLSLADANGYVISSSKTIMLDEATTTFDVSILQVELYRLSGNITGLGLGISNLQIAFASAPDSGRIFVPEPELDSNNATYSVLLEANVTYTISATGVNDYEILNNTIIIGAADQSSDIDFTPKTVHQVVINAPGLNETQFAALQLSFTNLNEIGYTYDFLDATNVALRDGVYKIASVGLDAYAIELALTSNLTISGSQTSKNLEFVPVNNWSFDDKEIAASDLYYKGLGLVGVKNEVAKGHLVAAPGNSIAIPVNPGEKVVVSYYYAANFTIDGGDAITTSSGSTSRIETVQYVYPGTESGLVMITFQGTASSYITNIAVQGIIDYAETITVGIDKEYQTINEALGAIAEMNRPNDDRVTVLIDPGNYEEMLVINSANVTLKNAAARPSIGLLNKGVDIEPGAVRITSYYGHGYNYYSMAKDNKWNAQVLAVNKANGYLSFENPGSGTTNGSYWNATVVVFASGFEAEDLIFENSFNQYISKKEADDIIVPNNGAPLAGARPTNFGDVTVQDRGLGYVERAAAIAVLGDKTVLNNCRVVGRQDSFYGHENARVVVYKGAMMGAVDYIFGAMNAVFYKTDLVLNTSDSSSDIAYITAAQQGSGRGYLMYENNVVSAKPGIETGSSEWGKPGYFGRPWAAATSEVVFFNTRIEASNNSAYAGQSMIFPEGWKNTLGGESAMMYEYGSLEESGENNSGSRAGWATLLDTPSLMDGTEISAFNFTKGNDGWDPIPLLDGSEDSDYDGVVDSEDNCPFTYNPGQEDFNNNGIGDACEDTDGDGLLDSEDNCPESTIGAVVDVFGCAIFELPSNNFNLVATAVTCNGEQDGQIQITAQNSNYNYEVLVNGVKAGSLTAATIITGLAAGSYDVCIIIEGNEIFQQCYKISIGGPVPISAIAQIDRHQLTATFLVTGGNTYFVNHNGKVTTTDKSTILVDLSKGLNQIEISTDSACQGTYFEEVFVSEAVLAYPNPTSDWVQFFVGGTDANAHLSLYNLGGIQLLDQEVKIPVNRVIEFNLSEYASGVYFISIQGVSTKTNLKIIKE